MRISEKSVEINFCAQFRASHAPNAFWFGLTQAQERRAGFDVMGNSAGRLIVFQFKASMELLSTGERRFRAPHHQFEALRDRLKGSRDIYYVLPAFGVSHDLPHIGWDVVSNSWLLNVADIPLLTPPTTASGALRKSGSHYFDLDEQSGHVWIHSDPVEARARSAREVANDDQFDRRSERLSFESFEDFSRWSKAIGEKAVALFVAEQ